MRYYVYVSDAKVDQFYHQLDAGQKADISVRVGFNLGLLEAAIENSGKTESQHQLQRLEAVEDYFVNVRAYDVGTLQSPGDFFRGKMELTWGQEGGTVMFVGRSDAANLVMLGSSRHVLGCRAEDLNLENSIIGPSGADAAIRYLERFVDETSSTQDDVRGEDALILEAALQVVEGVRTEQLSKEHRFLALTHLSGVVSGRRVIVASPIYVARDI